MDTRLSGGILLIVGTSIGGGLLALPIVSAGGGFITSSIMLLACWVVMTFGAFLLLEVNLWYPPRNNLISMAKGTLGPWGVFVTWVSYILLLYSLLSAYISAGGGLSHEFAILLGLPTSHAIDSVLFVVVFGAIVYRGIHFVDYANRGLMIAKMGSLFALILFTMPHIEPSRLIESDLRLAAGAITVMLTSFGFANIIPSLRSYFNDDVKKCRKAILIGSVIPLICYLLWNLAILGALSRGGDGGLMDIMQRGGSVVELSESLSKALDHASVTFLSGFFTTISVLTAFLCISLALSDFLADGLKCEKKGRGNIIIFTLTFLPSLLIVLFYPSIFIKALRYAGICCVILLLLLPALMVWRGRYRLGMGKGHYQVMGGKGALIVIILIAIGIILLGLKETL